MQKALSRSSSDQKFRRAGQRFIEDPSDIKGGIRQCPCPKLLTGTGSAYRRSCI